MGMFSKGEDKDWEMRMVLMGWGMAGGRTARCYQKTASSIADAFELSAF